MPSQGRAMEQYALDMGVRPESLRVTDPEVNTAAEAEAVAWMLPASAGVLLVTSAYHSDQRGVHLLCAEVLLQCGYAESLHFMRWRMERSLIHHSVSTLVFRRSVVNCLGGWDEVRVEADSEFLGRIRRYWGNDAVADVLPGVPLAFALQDKKSLTAARSTHLRTQFWGVRKLYRRLCEAWRAGVGNLDQLHFRGGTREGRFPVPPAILHGNSAVPEMDTDGSNVSGRVSGLFDAAWYLQRNPDVAESGKDPLDHYLNFGWEEGRAPSPWLDPGFYLRQCPGEDGRDQALLRHYVEKGEKQGFLPSRPYVQGHKPLVEEAPNMLFCAHIAGEELFGGERSFLDVLHACSLLPVNIFVAEGSQEGRGPIHSACAGIP